MERQGLYKQMINEDNNMLVEENEILRNNLTKISNYINKEFILITKNLDEMQKINIDYFIGQRSILQAIKKLL